MAPRPGHDQPNAGAPTVRLRLFVAGEEPNSAKARAVVARLCRERLAGRCQVEIVDVFEDFEAAIRYGVSVVPTLVVEGASSHGTIVGSLCDEAVVLAALGLSAAEGEHER